MSDFGAKIMKSPALKLDFAKGGGILPVVVQDFHSGEVLMLAYLNEESFGESVRTGRGVYFSRSRQKLWRKGESSGNVQIIREILLDCDRDSVLFKVEQCGGGACHTGHRSCFYTALGGDGEEREIYPASFNPDEVYHKK